MRAQAAADEHRGSLRALDQLLQQIAENPQPVGESFEADLGELEARIRGTLEFSLRLAEDAVGSDLRQELENMTDRLRETQKLIAESERQLETGVKLNQDADKKTNSAGRGGHL